MNKCWCRAQFSDEDFDCICLAQFNEGEEK